LMLALFYLVNNFIPVWQQGDAHRVSKIYWDTRYKAVVSFSDGAYADDSNLRTVFVKEEKQLSVGDYVIVVTQYGPFGVPVYSKNIVVRVPP